MSRRVKDKILQLIAGDKIETAKALIESQGIEFDATTELRVICALNNRIKKPFFLKKKVRISYVDRNFHNKQHPNDPYDFGKVYMDFEDIFEAIQFCLTFNKQL